MELKKLKCPDCNATLDIKENIDVMYCSYCGAKIYIEDEASNIVRMEKAKLEARKKNHEQDLKEAEDKVLLWKKKLGLYKTPEEEKRAWKTVGITWGCLILFSVVTIGLGSIFGSENPSLENFHKLELGMSYSECSNILGIDGHLTYEEGNATTYTWYNVSCYSDERDENGNCPIVIKLEFIDNKLTNRYENGLK